MPPIDEIEEQHAQEAEQRSAPFVRVLHEAIRLEGVDELERASSALAWSGLAAGLSMGFSGLTQALLASHLPDEPWRPLIVRLGYSIGFLLVILGRQQLFTENTLTAVIPVLTHRTWSMFLNMLRLWGIVLLANLAGALAFAWVLNVQTLMEPQARQELVRMGLEAMAHPVLSIGLRAIFGGWLIAMMVWMLPFAESSRLNVVVIVTYVIGLASFPHIIAGAVETFYVVTAGLVPWQDCLVRWVLPTLLGNIAGGTFVVAALNHAQVVAGKKAEAVE